MKTTYIIKHTCLKCKYKWEGRLKDPKLCPNCKSREWRLKNE